MRGIRPRRPLGYYVGRYVLAPLLILNAAVLVAAVLVLLVAGIVGTLT